MHEVTAWRVSAHSASEGNCVEVGTTPAGSVVAIAVRDTKDRDGAILRVSAETWSRFTATLR